MTVTHAYTVDITHPVVQGALGYDIVSGDANSHVIEVALTDNGTPSVLTTAVASLYVVRPDGATVATAMNIADNVVSVAMPVEASAITGRIYIMVRVAISGEILTVLCKYATVRSGITGVLVDPGDAIPSIDALLVQIAAMEAATLAANQAVADVEAALDANADPLPVVRYDEAQSLSAPQKAQFLSNAGAATAAQGSLADTAVQPETISAMTSGGVVIGGVVTAQGTPDQTVAVTECVVITPEGKRYVVAANSALAADAADATNPRIDIVYITSAGVLTYLAGTAAASPTQPTTPSNGTLLAAITRAANDNTIASGDIADKRYILKKPVAMTLLWTNSSPGSTFAGQKITVDTTPYDYVLVQTLLATTVQNNASSLFVKKGATGQIIACTVTNKYRVISVFDNTGVTFLDAYNVTAYGTTVAVDNTMLVPYQIFGVKNMG